MKTINVEQTKDKYPNIHARGVVEIHVVEKRGLIYQIYKRADGSMSKPMRAFGN